MGALDRADHPVAERQVGADPAAVGVHGSHRTVCGPRAVAVRPPRSTVRYGPAMDRLSYEDKVIRAFVKDGRLVSIPARDKKRRVVLRYLADQCFPEDRPYPEKEVNQRLALFHPDVAALRR